MNSEAPEHRHPEVPPGVHPEMPEERYSPVFVKWWVGGWLSPLLVAGFTLFWCLLIYWLIGDRPVEWKYGVVPYVPAASVLSSERAPAGPPRPQVVLPEREPEEEHENR